MDFLNFLFLFLTAVGVAGIWLTFIILKNMYKRLDTFINETRIHMSTLAAESHIPAIVERLKCVYETCPDREFDRITDGGAKYLKDLWMIKDYELNIINTDNNRTLIQVRKKENK